MAACALGVELFEYECSEFAAILSRCECLRFPDPMAAVRMLLCCFAGGPIHWRLSEGSCHAYQNKMIVAHA